MLALDHAREMLGLGGVAEQAKGDVRLEGLAARHRVQRLVELDQLGCAVGRHGIEVGGARRRRHVVAHQPFQQEPEGPAPGEAVKRGPEPHLLGCIGAEHQGEMRADQVGLARMVLRPEPPQCGVVGLRQHRPGHDVEHQP